MNAHWTEHRPGRLAVLAWVLLLSSVLTSRVLGQPPNPGAGLASAAYFEVEAGVSRKLGAARELLINRRWKDAFDILDPLSASAPSGLVAADDGRYVSVRSAIQSMLSVMNDDGLKLYRSRIDPLAKRWFEAGSDSDLKRILDQAFHSSFGEKAALILGERAWERGDVSLARWYWERILPPFEGDQPPPGIPPVPYLIRPTVDPWLIRARMILCSLGLGELSRAEREIGLFNRKRPGFEGKLAGREGNIGEILEAELALAQSEVLLPINGSAMLGGTADRAGNAGEGIEIGAVRWTEALPRMEVTFRENDQPRPNFPAIFGGPPSRARERSRHLALATFPVAHEMGLFTCDENSVFAFDLTSEKSGKPLWGESSQIYTLKQPGITQESESRIGLPAFSMAIADQKLFARLGRSVSPRNTGPLITVPLSTLVCLDLSREGDLKWKLTADYFGDMLGNWIFNGAPLPYDGRLYVLVRNAVPQLSLHIACLDPETGKVIWNRKICQGSELFSGEYDESQHMLLSAADGRIYCCTNLGSVIAINAQDGHTLWANHYQRVEIEKVPELHDREMGGPNPCVAVDGLVVCAPTDSNQVVAFDAASGVRLWSVPIAGTFRQVVGIDQGCVVVAANQLVGLDAETGNSLWRQGRNAPDAKTAGRGLIAEGRVYWPCPEEIQVVDISNGRLMRLIPLAEQHTLRGGGNLLIHEGFLICAQAERLIAFWEFGESRRRQLEEEMVEANQRIVPAIRAGIGSSIEKDWVLGVAAWKQVIAGFHERGLRFREMFPELTRRLLIPQLQSTALLAEKAQDFTAAKETLEIIANETHSQQIRAANILSIASVEAEQRDFSEALARIDALSKDPVLRHLPVVPGGVRSIGTACEIERNRIEVLQRTAIEKTGDKPAAIANPPTARDSGALAETRRASNASPVTQVPEIGLSNEQWLRTDSDSPASRRWTASVQRTTHFASAPPQVAQVAARWVATAGDALMCRDGVTGKLRWSIPLSEAVYWVSGTEQLVLLAGPRRLSAFSAEHGNLLWTSPWATDSPISERSRFHISGRENCVLMLNPDHSLEALDLAHGNSRWRFQPIAEGRVLTLPSSHARNGDDSSSLLRISGRLRSYWLIRDGYIAVQTEHPLRTIFLRVEDGLAQEAADSGSALWLSDPQGDDANIWGTFRGHHEVGWLDVTKGATGMVPMSSFLDGIVPKYKAGDHLVLSGSFILSFPGGQRLRLWSRETGITAWEKGPANSNGDGEGDIRIDGTTLYHFNRRGIESRDLNTGSLLWNWSVSDGDLDQKTCQLVGSRMLLVASKPNSNSTDLHVIDQSRGERIERWRMTGEMPVMPLVTSGGGVYVMTNSAVAFFHPRARLNIK